MHRTKTYRHKLINLRAMETLMAYPAIITRICPSKASVKKPKPKRSDFRYHYEWRQHIDAWHVLTRERLIENENKICQCYKCGTWGVLIAGELPVVCQENMPVRTSGICGGLIQPAKPGKGRSCEIEITGEETCKIVKI